MFAVRKLPLPGTKVILVDRCRLSVLPLAASGILAASSSASSSDTSPSDSFFVPSAFKKSKNQQQSCMWHGVHVVMWDIVVKYVIVFCNANAQSPHPPIASGSCFFAFAFAIALALLFLCLPNKFTTFLFCLANRLLRHKLWQQASSGFPTLSFSIQNPHLQRPSAWPSPLPFSGSQPCQ